jgi:hypothetical protein
MKRAPFVRIVILGKLRGDQHLARTVIAEALGRCGYLCLTQDQEDARLVPGADLRAEIQEGRERAAEGGLRLAVIETRRTPRPRA